MHPAMHIEAADVGDEGRSGDPGRRNAHDDRHLREQWLSSQRRWPDRTPVAQAGPGPEVEQVRSGPNCCTQQASLLT